ncbi:AzlD domain-containing protein [Haloechinothrix sp. LS1_15]|uniref:AzlD domain-containing protein n=1 Tax=Haloechinothrix sp. LS1_15 TaxID=2652248 RepID=UPI002945890A|nr:AzlD domain-containing protein [Haloechinothrix sp. LS1_15]MDV6013327.1 AzlD domain-containing protein [Haloechinothrix sp. LS1_15]
MSTTPLFLVAVAALALGTYAFRGAGPALRGRFAIPSWLDDRVTLATVVLLVALVATQALTEGDGFAGWSRPAGVAVGGVLAWFKAPFLVAVLAAAGTTSMLRLLGVP